LEEYDAIIVKSDTVLPYLYHVNQNRIFVKNMVCARCVAAVEKILTEEKIAFDAVLLGEVTLKKSLSASQKETLGRKLRAAGFDLIDDRKTRIIENIKTSILDYTRNLPQSASVKLSSYLSERLPYDYSYLSDLFSSVEGSTIEHFFIGQRIEKVKELLVYDQLSLSEIAYELGYSSVHHLSSQFKRITGLTPSHFKMIGATRRKKLDEL
jgi:AraC-like DNA-binding protein